MIVDTHNKQPQGQQHHPDPRNGQRVGEKSGHERGVEARQVPEPSERRDGSEDARQESRPQDEVADREPLEPEEDLAHVEGPAVQLEEQERQRLVLLRAEGAQVRSPSQDVQRAELEEGVERSDRAAREVEECSKQGDGPVDGLEQLVHEDRRDEIARGGDKVGRDRQAEQSLVRQDARRRRPTSRSRHS